MDARVCSALAALPPEDLERLLIQIEALAKRRGRKTR
jgi:hypothetical protein